MIDDPVLVNDWHVVARAADLPEGKLLPVRLLGQDLVLWRLNGQLLAWQDLCLHRGARLSLGWIDGERLVCPYHGWTYNNAGQCVHIPAHPDQPPPARARVRSYQAREGYGLIWVSLGSPAHDLPPLPEWEDSSFRKVLCGPYRYKAHAPRAVENFLDVAHLPIVHAGLLGVQERAEIGDYQVEVGPEGVTASNIRIWQPNPDGIGEGREVTYTYRVFRPLTAYFVKTTVGPKHSILLTVTPVDELDSIGWMWVCLNYRHDVPEEDLRAFQDQIVSQDIPVVESQRPELLPLDLQAELHLRSDRTAIAYRQWLKQLGLSFGTS
jgi:phenylpropionate dioxygenase-like ring-hydroxylating dioxygenase large terminal subunit